MKTETMKKIENEIVRFGRKTLDKEYSAEELKRAFPFHAAFFTGEAMRAFKVQRSLVTKMGMQLYPSIALMIAQDRFSKVFLGHQIESPADQGMIAKADRILDELRTQGRTPDFLGEWKEIVAAASGRKSLHRVIADLYIEDFSPGPLFMEIKSPRPNLDVCAESKKKMLYYKIINYGTKAEAYLGFPYNPFVRREEYAHTFTLSIMDIDREVLMGDEMWNKLGGEGTFDQLLRILDKAGEELRKGSASKKTQQTL